MVRMERLVGLRGAYHQPSICRYRLYPMAFLYRGLRAFSGVLEMARIGMQIQN